MISPAFLHEILSYDPLTGTFRWKYNLSREPRWNTRWAGRQAGYLRDYWMISIDQKRFYSHRIAWAMMTGKWPAGQIDHKNTDRSDNRWENLREADLSKNAQNRNLTSINTSGHKGVYWVKRDKKWGAVIKLNGKREYLGQFHDKLSAHEAYKARAVELFGQFARP
jgi:hypothetical protein